MKSLPNIIKSNCVLITNKDIKVIDSNPKDDFTTLSFKEAIDIGETDEIIQEDEEQREELYQMNHEKNTSEHLEKMKSFAETIIEDARREAEEMKQKALDLAMQEIETLRQNTIEEAYQQGMAQAEESINEHLAQIDAKRNELEEEYEQKIDEMQREVTELLIAYVQKITGIVIEEKQIIMYLVKNAVKANSSCNEFRIIVSKEDFEEVDSRVDEIKEMVKSTANIAVVENPEFEKNQCKIETDKNIIDCGIETKISNLVMALKLLT